MFAAASDDIFAYGQPEYLAKILSESQRLGLVSDCSKYIISKRGGVYAEEFILKTPTSTIYQENFAHLSRGWPEGSFGE